MSEYKNTTRIIGDVNSGLLVVYKKLGETPLQCLDRIRKELPQYGQAVLSYAGRLDPLASGLLLVLVGEENKNRNKYLNLPKSYEFYVLWGISTDTFDPLGLVSAITSVAITEKQVLDITKSFEGLFLQEYPAFSSRTVNGTPLFQLAREGRLTDIDLPKKEVVIKSIDLLSHSFISAGELLNKVQEMILCVSGDFRQDLILNKWQEVLSGSGDIFYISKMRVSAESGLYVRALVNAFGAKVSCGALAFGIDRITLGEYHF